MTSVKFNYNNEVRLSTLTENEKNVLPFSRLVDSVKILFTELNQRNFFFTWTDDDNDIISCSSDAEVEAAIRILQKRSPVINFVVKINDSFPGNNLLPFLFLL
jgi:hypothetical protein